MLDEETKREIKNQIELNIIDKLLIELMIIKSKPIKINFLEIGGFICLLILTIHTIVNW